MELFDGRVSRGKKVQSTRLNRSSHSSSSSSNSGGKQQKPNELVFKVASNIKGNRSDQSIDYITRNKEEHDKEMFIEPFNESGDILKKDELENLKKEWKEEFSTDKNINSRNMTHFVFSIDVEPTEENKQKFELATKEFLTKRFADEGFRYIAAYHDDTKNPHFHVLVNNNNLETEKKLRIDIAWHYETRLMAKEALRSHGIEQEATFKKDRQFLTEKVKAQQVQAEKDYTFISNWYEAKLKTASHSDEHFKLIQKQVDVLNELKKEVSAKPEHSKQAQVELAQQINQVKQDLIHYDRYSTRAEANQAIKAVIKAAEPERSVIKAALGISQEREQKLDEKERRQRYFLAKELVKGEMLIQASTTIKPSEKRQLINAIDTQKKSFAESGIDIKRMEREQQSLLSENTHYVDAMRGLNSAVRGTERQIKKDGELDQDAATKRVSRLLYLIQKAERSELTDVETKRLSQAKTEVFAQLEKQGIKTQAIEKDWRQGSTLKQGIDEVKKALEKPLSLQEAQHQQARIYALTEQLKDPGNKFGKKELIALNISVERSQQRLDAQLDNGHTQVIKTLRSVERGIESLNTKLTNNEKDKANKQAFVSTKVIIQLQDDVQKSALLPNQKSMVLQKLAHHQSELEKHGYSVTDVRQKMAYTEKVKDKLEQVRGLTMNHVRAKGYDKSAKLVSEVSQSLKTADIPRDKKRDIQKELKAKSSELQQGRANDSRSLTTLMTNIKEITKKVEYLSSREHTSPLTNLERLNNRRAIEALTRELNGLIKEAKPLLGSEISKDVRTGYQQQLQKANTLAHKHDVGRSR